MITRDPALIFARNLKGRGINCDPPGGKWAGRGRQKIKNSLDHVVCCGDFGFVRHIYALLCVKYTLRQLELLNFSTMQAFMKLRALAVATFNFPRSSWSMLSFLASCCCVFAVCVDTRQILYESYTGNTLKRFPFFFNPVYGFCSRSSPPPLLMLATLC